MIGASILPACTAYAERRGISAREDAFSWSLKHEQPLDSAKSTNAPSRSGQGQISALIWRDPIRHPCPEFAIRFAFAMVALALRELTLFNHTHLFEADLPIDDELLARELTAMFLRYLGLDLQQSRTSGA